MEQRLYLPGELLRYLAKNELVFYIPILAFNDVTKYDAVRASSYRDACNALCSIFDSR